MHLIPIGPSHLLWARILILHRLISKLNSLLLLPYKLFILCLDQWFHIGNSLCLFKPLTIPGWQSLIHTASWMLILSQLAWVWLSLTDGIIIKSRSTSRDTKIFSYFSNLSHFSISLTQLHSFILHLREPFRSNELFLHIIYHPSTSFCLNLFFLIFCRWQRVVLGWVPPTWISDSIV